MVKFCGQKMKKEGSGGRNDNRTEGGGMNWNTEVGAFADRMVNRFKQKDKEGWGNHEFIPEKNYKERAIKNILRGDYVDAANLCLLADKQSGTEYGDI